MYKLFAGIALLAAVSAEYQATSYSSYNNNHNSVQHLGSVPAVTVAKFAAPAAPIYSAPVVSKVAVPAISVAKYVAPVAYSAPATYSAPITKYAPAPTYTVEKEEYAPAQYEFAYGIQEPHTGDYHSQQEHRDGDRVVGQYSLHEADGTVRIVKYSDDGHGFNAVVEREGTPTEAPVYKKVVAVAAPQYVH